MDPEDIRHRFAFHAAPTEEKRDAHTSVRQNCRLLADFLNERLPEGQEKSLVVTKLEEVMFWANAAIARHGGVIEAPASPVERAQAAYARYGAVTEHKNFQGDPMPAWEDLTDTIQAAWIAAARG